MHTHSLTVARDTLASMTTADAGTSMFTVYDDDREIQFEGQLLGAASSFHADKQRWIEISVHRTRGGKYVVSGVGKTLLPGEKERRWVQVSEAPEGCVESLHQYDSDGVRYLTRTARSALTRACAVDPELRDCYMIEVIS